MKHTPGPWAVAPRRQYEFPVLSAARGSLGSTVAMVGARSDDEGAANASLIAAAPDLLAALLELVDIVEGAIAQRPGRDLDSFTLQPARAAIEKATGA